MPLIILVFSLLISTVWLKPLGVHVVRQLDSLGHTQRLLLPSFRLNGDVADGFVLWAERRWVCGWMHDLEAAVGIFLVKGVLDLVATVFSLFVVMRVSVSVVMVVLVSVVTGVLASEVKGDFASVVMRVLAVRVVGPVGEADETPQPV